TGEGAGREPSDQGSRARRRDVRQATGQISRLGTLKSLLQRFAFLALIGLTFALMLIGKADTVLVERARIAITDAVTSILGFRSGSAIPARARSWPATTGPGRAFCTSARRPP